MEVEEVAWRTLSRSSQPLRRWYVALGSAWLWGAVLTLQGT